MKYTGVLVSKQTPQTEGSHTWPVVVDTREYGPLPGTLAIWREDGWNFRVLAHLNTQTDLLVDAGNYLDDTAIREVYIRWRAPLASFIDFPSTTELTSETIETAIAALQGIEWAELRVLSASDRRALLRFVKDILRTVDR